MPKLKDGSVVSSYFTTRGITTGKDVYNEGLKMQAGQVEKIHFIDDASNVSKAFVEYDVSVRDARGGQSTYRNLRSMSSIFGTNDFEETILEPNEFAFTGKLDPSNLFSNKNGTMVLIAFIDGSKDKPTVVGAINHPRKKDGAKRTDGIRKKGEFRGLQWEINKEGEFSLTYNGNKTPDGKLARPGTGPTQIKIDNKGVLTITDNKGQKFSMDRTNTTISFGNGTTVKFDGQNDQIKLTTAGTGELNLKAGKVAIGASGTELLQKISDSLDKILTWANNVGAVHYHLGNLGYSTASPTQASGYTQLGSDLSTIKGMIDGIKGSL